MLEQAVYAGRNHTLSLAVALTLLTAAPAQAGAVRADGDEAFGDMVAAPAGGVWVGTQVGLSETSSVTRVRADGRVTRTRIEGVIGSGAVGADGAVYFLASPSPLLRVDDAGTATPLSLSPARPGVDGETIAPGPDGRLWATAGDYRRFAQIAPDGATTYVPNGRRSCSGFDPDQFALTRASDGAMWFADGCHRLVRGGRVTELPDVAESLVADAAGGVWFLLEPDHAVGHATADGQLTYQVLERRPSALAAAADGGAWLADGSCRLTHVAPDGSLSYQRASVATTSLALAPDGLWLANDKLLARADDPRPCDDEAPRPTVRRAGAIIRISVNEAATLDVTALTSRHFADTRTYRLKRSGHVRYRLTRALARAKRVYVIVRISDAEGNTRTVVDHL